LKLVFIDTEFTGLHGKAELISVGLVTQDGRECYVIFKDYPQDQVTPWIRDHVVALLGDGPRRTYEEGCKVIEEFLSEWSGGEGISLVSAGKMNDLVLFFDLWRTRHRGTSQFSFFEHLPGFLKHYVHLDLDTLLACAGFDPGFDREEFVGATDRNLKHNALYDAQIVRRCFFQLIDTGIFPELARKIERTLR